MEDLIYNANCTKTNEMTSFGEKKDESQQASFGKIVQQMTLSFETQLLSFVILFLCIYQPIVQWAYAQDFFKKLGAVQTLKEY